MRTESQAINQDEPTTDLMEEVGSFEYADGNGALPQAKRYVRLQIFIPRKQAISLEELRIRRMKRGQDISRSRLLSEAIQYLCKQETGLKIGEQNA